MSSSSDYADVAFEYASPNEIIAAAILLPLISLASVTLRFFTRRRYRHDIRVDDWLLVPSWFMAAGIGACLVVGVKHKAIGFKISGAKPESMEDKNYVPPALVLAQQLQWATVLLIIVGLSCIKLSALFFYKRIFDPSPKSALGRVIWVEIGANAVWAVLFFFLILFECGRNFWAIWSSREQNFETCPDLTLRSATLNASEVIINIMILVTPIPVMRPAKKLAVTGVMMIAFTALIASVVRIVIGVQITTKSLDSDDVQADAITAVMFWFHVETNLALTASCLPSLAPLFKDTRLRTTVHSARSWVSTMSSRTRIRWGSTSTAGLRRPSDATIATEKSRAGINSAELRSPEPLRSNPVIAGRYLHHEWISHSVSTRSQITGVRKPGMRPVYALPIRVPFSPSIGRAL